MFKCIALIVVVYIVALLSYTYSYAQQGKKSPFFHSLPSPKKLDSRIMCNKKLSPRRTKQQIDGALRSSPDSLGAAAAALEFNLIPVVQWRRRAAFRGGRRKRRRERRQRRRRRRRKSALLLLLVRAGPGVARRCCCCCFHFFFPPLENGKVFKASQRQPLGGAENYRH